MNTRDIQTVLWDIPKDKIDTLPEQFLLQRALSYGNVFLIFDMMKKYGIPTVKKVFDAMKPTAIPHRKYIYIKNFLLS